MKVPPVLSLHYFIFQMCTTQSFSLLLSQPGVQMQEYLFSYLFTVSNSRTCHLYLIIESWERNLIFITCVLSSFVTRNKIIQTKILSHHHSHLKKTNVLEKVIKLKTQLTLITLWVNSADGKLLVSLAFHANCLLCQSLFSGLYRIESKRSNLVCNQHTHKIENRWSAKFSWLG